MGISATLSQNAQTLINVATWAVTPVPLSGSNISLTASQVNTPIIQFTGTLTANVIATLPAPGTWTVYNSTSGAFTVTLTNGAGATAVVPQSQSVEVLSLSGAGIHASVGGSVGGVSSFNTRTGAVVLQAADITGVGGALLASPAFTGTPTAPTPTAGDNSTKLATTAFVAAGYAPLASPALTGTPTAPTPAGSSNSTALATTAFVQTVLSAVTGGLNYQGTWNASTNTPALTSSVGTKGFLYVVSVAGSTTLDGNSSWSVGDFVNFNGSVWQRIPAQATGVSAFNTRTGAVTLISSDVTTALGFTPANNASLSGYAPIASPAFTGVPTAPTPTAGDNSTKIATTAYVASYAQLASPAFTGVPTVPTATTGTNTTQIASTAFVIAQMGTYAPLAGPAFTGVPTGPTASVGTNTTQLATTAFVIAQGGTYAPLASPAFTGTPTAPTATAGTNTTQVASTAFVQTALGSYAPLANPQFTGRTQSPAYSYTVTALGSVSGTQTLNLGAASEWTMTIAGATTLVFTNTLAANTTQTFFLRITNGGSATITWPASTKFANKTAPTLTSSGVDMLGVTYDTTTSTYMVFVIGLNIG